MDTTYTQYYRKVRDKDTTKIILVGHSSGAQAILRYTEQYPVYASVLVSATYSDLGDAHERMSGYYPQKQGDKENAYLFNEMKKICRYGIQFHSDDDPSKSMKQNVSVPNCRYHRYVLPVIGSITFFEFQPELLDVILSLC